MDLKELQQLLQILDEKDIAEFELEEEGMKLRIRKAAPLGSSSPRPIEAAAAVLAGQTSPGPAPTASSAGEPAAPPPVPEVPANQTVVTSPIVGTFYRAPNPDAAPFVQVGDRVRVGQVLCIIEAMKLMNEIEAEVAGEVLKIHQENGQPVQFGDPLFSIRVG